MGAKGARRGERENAGRNAIAGRTNTRKGTGGVRLLRQRRQSACAFRRDVLGPPAQTGSRSGGGARLFPNYGWGAAGMAAGLPAVAGATRALGGAVEWWSAGVLEWWSAGV